MKKVLDVGQCDLDNSSINDMLKKRFDVTVDRAHSSAEAIAAIQKQDYDLVLINRILDADGTPGIAVLRAIKNDTATSDKHVMMVSNYAEAQQEAVAAGAENGFGKSELNSASTIELLTPYLG
jgi:CheY-like chemotaxis protein